MRQRARRHPAEVVPDENGRVEITVDGTGFHPETIHARAGQPLRLVFTRTADIECAREVVFPDQSIRRELPMNRPLEIPITAPPSGRVAFTCGMDMLRGAIVAHAAD
jgi:plastocyanin domain-containing protein